jgi:hypothetical protein
VFTFELAHGFRRFTEYCAQANYDYVVNDRTPDTMPSQKARPAREKGTKWSAEDVFPNRQDLDRITTPSEFDMNGVSFSNACITRASLDKQCRNTTAELLRVRPTKSLEDCPLPVCPASLYGKAKCRPTQTKTKKSINPGQQVRESMWIC